MPTAMVGATSASAASPTPRDHFGADRIGADQPGWPVLFGRADWQDDPPAGLKIIFDLLPGLQLKLHSRSLSS
jgi:hypothetical protein